jgi:hypothetical protein
MDPVRSLVKDETTVIAMAGIGRNFTIRFFLGDIIRMREAKQHREPELIEKPAARPKRSPLRTDNC